MTFDVITSNANPLLKDIRKAQEQGGLTSQGWLVAEGPHLVEEALRSGLKIHCIVFSQGRTPLGEAEATRLVEVPANVFRALTNAQTPQGVLALVEPPQHTGALNGGLSLIVVLDGVQDPGNVGTIARSAEAFGANALVVLDDTANPFHPKTLRASAGSLFRLPFVRSTRDWTLEVPLFAGVRDTSAPAPWECDLASPCAIAIGSEGQGVSPQLLRKSRPVAIPTKGVESLNAAAAASILLYEAARQRRKL